MSSKGFGIIYYYWLRSLQLNNEIIKSLRMTVNDLRQLEVGHLYFLLQFVFAATSNYAAWYARCKNIFCLSTVSTTIYLRQEEEKLYSQWQSWWSDYHRDQHFPVTPTSILIIEITPSSRSSDPHKQLCAHLFLFDKTYHFMTSTYIYCMILTMTLFLRLFLGFSAKNGNEDVPIRDYFGFNHVLFFLSTVFRNSFLLQSNSFFK